VDLHGLNWPALSALLDRALELEPQARDAWLQRLHAERPEAGAALDELLREHRLLVARGFLTDAPHHGFKNLEGQVLGSYTLMRRIGHGGMGSVWLAQRSDGRFEGSVAIKLLGLAVRGRNAEERFKREGSVLAQLAHPNIARLLDAGVSHAGQPYLVLEYVDGTPIDRYCNDAALDVKDRIRLFLDVLDAVSEAHRKLIVHRDLKPSNVYVNRDGAVKLLDFGIARLLSERDSAGGARTHRNVDMLTPEYAAPEQLEAGDVTTATDVYSLGVVLFELLAGQRPFDSAAGRQREAAARGEPPRLSCRLVDARGAWRRALAGDLDSILAKALHGDPGERYGTVAAFGDDLRRYLMHEPVKARPGTLPYRAGRFVRRNRAAVASGLAVAGVLVAAAAVSTMQTIEARRQGDEARFQLRRAQASSDFVTALLSQSGPGGRGLTPSELLDRGVEAIKTRYGDDPAFAIHMLVVLSGRYMDIGRHDREYEVLREAERVARSIGDPHVLLDVHCNTIETEVFAGMAEAAAARLREARQLMASLDAVKPLTAVNCLRQEAAAAGADGRPADAVVFLERAKARLEKEGLVHGNIYSSLFSWLAGFSRAAGRPLDAHRYHEQDVALMERSGRRHTVGGILTQVAHAGSLLDLGEVRSAADRLAALVLTDGAAELNPVAALRYGDALSQLAHHDEALTWIDRGLEALRAREDARLAYGEVLRAQALVRAGRHDAAEPELETLIVRLVSGSPTAVQARARLAMAEVLLQRIDLVGAAGYLDQVFALLSDPTAAASPEAVRALLLKSRIAAARGDVDGSVAAARAAVRILQSNVRDERRSASAGMARSVLAHAETLRGDADAARSSLELAVEAFSNSLGTDHPDTRDAAALLTMLRS
jgi:eukaryotic-like serine/threonine-protein kinase